MPDAPSDAATDADAAAPAPLVAPFDWVGVLGTGQSLSVGANSVAMSTAQPFGNLKLVDTGPDPKYPISANEGSPQWATTPLVEPIRPNNLPGTGSGYNGDGYYPNNIAGETPHSGMANTLSQLWHAAGGVGDYVTVHSVVGAGGRCLDEINKPGGQRAYPASIREAQVWKALAGAQSKTFGFGGIILTHGECDSGTPSYALGLYSLWQDYQTDLKAITGQTRDIVLFASQQSAVQIDEEGSPVQLWRAAAAHPDQIICTGPKYQYQYGYDSLHFSAPAYERLGQKYAEVFDLVVNHGVKWRPVQPNQLTRVGAKITLDFDVPNPPLVWDSHLAPPHQTKNAAWKNGNGFEVADAVGNALTISRVTLQGASVVLELLADPGPHSVTVRYAITQDADGTLGGNVTGMRGLLRDSDELVGWDAETLEVNVTAGSPVVTSTTAGQLVHRTGYDIVTGDGVAEQTVVLSQDSDDQVTLSAPWSGATGKATLSFHHDEHNYGVHFTLYEPASPKANAAYLIVNHRTGWGIDVFGASRDSGAPVGQYRNNRQPNQSWLLQPATSGGFVLANVASTLAFNLINAQALGQVNQATPDASVNQSWTIEPASTPNYYRLKSGAGDWYLSSPSDTEGDVLVVQPSNTVDPAAQEWELIAL